MIQANSLIVHFWENRLNGYEQMINIKLNYQFYMATAETIITVSKGVNNAEDDV